MTAHPKLARVLRRTRHLFLDFDGPICTIFAGYTAPTVAADLRRQLAVIGAPISETLARTDDPLEVLRRTDALGRDEWTRQVADALRDAELRAADTAEPTPGSRHALAVAIGTGRRVSVVSNNSVAAVLAYLERHQLLGLFTVVVGRYDGMAPSLLKPNPHLVQRALIEAGDDAASAVLIGDSTSDIEAARSLSVASIGFRTDPVELAALIAAGADATVSTLEELASALQEQPYLDGGGTGSLD